MSSWDRRRDQTAAALKSGPQLPPWWPALQVVVGFGLAVWLLVGVATGDSPAELASPGDLGGPAAIGSGPAAVGAGTVSGGGAGDPGQVPVVNSPGELPDLSPQPSEPEPELSEPELSEPEPDPAETVNIPGADGTPVAVDVQAVQAGRAYVTALFTGSFADVPLAAGTTAPPIARRWSDPQLGTPTVLQTEQPLRLSFPVDPDGEGPAALRNIDVQVQTEDGTWTVRG